MKLLYTIFVFYNTITTTIPVMFNLPKTVSNFLKFRQISQKIFAFKFILNLKANVSYRYVKTCIHVNSTRFSYYSLFTLKFVGL